MKDIAQWTRGRPIKRQLLLINGSARRILALVLPAPKPRAEGGTAPVCRAGEAAGRPSSGRAAGLEDTARAGQPIQHAPPGTAGPPRAARPDRAVSAVAQIVAQRRKSPDEFQPEYRQKPFILQRYLAAPRKHVQLLQQYLPVTDITPRSNSL